MTRDDIIRFGEQADEAADRKIKMRGEYHPDWHQVRDEAFAALVAAHERRRSERAEELLKKALNYAMDDWGLRLKIAAHFEEFLE